MLRQSTKSLLGSLLLGLLCLPAIAHEDKPHDAAPPTGDVPQLLSVANSAVAKIGELVTAQKLDGVHEQTDLLNGALKALAANVGGSADQKKRLESALRQVSAAADGVHEAADGAQQKKAETEAKKLAAAMKLLQAQIPASAAKAAASPAPAPSADASDDVGAVKNVLAAYKQGLEQLDVSKLGHLFTADSQVFESGGVEGTFANYLEHHIGPELAEFSEFSFRDYAVDVRLELPYAFTTETYVYRIVLKADGRIFEKKGLATSVLKKTAAGWQIQQMHTSSRNLPKAK